METRLLVAYSLIVFLIVATLAIVLYLRKIGRERRRRHW